MSKKVSSEKMIKDIRRRTRTKYSSEEKIRIVLDGIRGEISPAELCRSESISSNFITVGAQTFLRLERNGFRETLSVKPVLRKYPSSKKKMSN